MSTAISYIISGGYPSYYISLAGLLPSEYCFVAVSWQLNFSSYKGGMDYGYPDPKIYKGGNISVYMQLDGLARVWRNYLLDFSEGMITDYFRYESDGTHPLDPRVNFPSGGNFPLSGTGQGLIPGVVIPVLLEGSGWGTLSDAKLDNYTGYFVPNSMLYGITHLRLVLDPMIDGFLYFHCFGYTESD